MTKYRIYPYKVDSWIIKYKLKYLPIWVSHTLCDNIVVYDSLDAAKREVDGAISNEKIYMESLKKSKGRKYINYP